MGLYKRGGIWWISYMAFGKQVRESARTANRRVADCLFAKRKTEVFEGRFQLPRSDCPTLNGWAREIMDSVSNSSTRSRYSASIQNLIAFFGDVKLLHITAERIGEYQGFRLRKGRSPGTVNRDVAVLSRLLKLAKKRRFVLHNPCEQTERLNERHTRRLAKPLSYEEEQSLLRHCDPLLRIFVVLLIETGLRSKKEALPLKWTDVDLLSDPGSIVVRASKTAAGVRRVWLTEHCREELQAWAMLSQPQKSGYVFLSPRKKNAFWTGYQLPWKAAIKAAGLGDRRVYDLRATFATRANAAQATALTLAQLLGHSSIAILPIYAKALDANTRSVIAKLDEIRAHAMNSHLIN